MVSYHESGEKWLTTVITTVSGCDRYLFAHLYIANSVPYQDPSTIKDTPLSLFVQTSGQPVLTLGHSS